MLLIVEDGTGVSNANTYIDLTYLHSFAETMGWELADNDEDNKSLVLQAMPFIESQNYQGAASSSVQLLRWPRVRVELDGNLIASNIIPEGIKKAQAQAAYLVSQGVDLLPTSGETGAVIEETVGPITTKYSDKYPTFSTYFGVLSSYLKPYLLNVNGGYKLSPWFGY